jgi:hypothetical protein
MVHSVEQIPLGAPQGNWRPPPDDVLPPKNWETRVTYCQVVEPTTERKRKLNSAALANVCS